MRQIGVDVAKRGAGGHSVGSTGFGDDDKPSGRFSMQEFFVDFLGGLVPGILFTMALVIVLWPPLSTLVRVSNGGERFSAGEQIRSMLSATANTPNMIWIALFAGWILIAYLLGHLFYRRDPKEPNRASFRRVSGFSAEKWLSLSDDTREELRRNYGCTTPSECEFPFPYLDDYLEARGHDHLLPFIRWTANADYRSKTYINLLKIRLRYYVPERCGQIVRNEAHVRLATSSWYMSRTLVWVGLVGAVIALLCALLVGFGQAMDSDSPTSWTDVPRWSLTAAAWPIFVIGLAWYSGTSIERFLHYQRLREAFFVLETAFVAFRDQPDLLDPPFRGFRQAVRRPASD